MSANKMELIKKINKLLMDIEKLSPPSESLESYLLSNLKKYLRLVEKANSAQEMENAAKLLEQILYRKHGFG